jgi:hypothetical protein
MFVVFVVVVVVVADLGSLSFSLGVACFSLKTTLKLTRMTALQISRSDSLFEATQQLVPRHNNNEIPG